MSRTSRTHAGRQLTALFERLRAGSEDLTDDMPVYSKHPPKYAHSRAGAWSWDRTHVLVGSCRQDAALITRREWIDRHDPVQS